MVEAYVTDPQAVQSIAEFIKGTSAMPNAPRLCPEHGEAVKARIEGTDLDKPSQSKVQAVLTGCCRAAIDRELEVIGKTLGWIDYLKSQGKGQAQ
jgi:hypothetical protein